MWEQARPPFAELVGERLAAAEVPHAVIDLDWLRNTWPSPPGDRFNLAIELRNLRDVARNFLDAGAVRLVLAGVVETHAEPSWTATWKPSACHWRFAAFGSPCRCCTPG